MSTPRFDLVDVVHTIRNNRRTIIVISLVAAILGGVVYLVSKREYKAEGSFIMSNPLYTDRNNLFQATGIQFVDYFAGDDDVDRLMNVVESDTVKWNVAQKLHMAEYYRLDMNDPKKVKKLLETFKGNFKANRTEYNSIELSYTDPDPKLAADIVNETMKKIEEVFRDYYVGQRNKMAQSLKIKVAEMDTTISTLTDSLGKLRDQYKIYDLINPARQNIVNSTVKGSGANLGWAMEQVQNLESLKDQAVSDRARYISRYEEYSTTGNAANIPLIHVLNAARVPVKSKPPGLILTVLSCAIIGLFFSTIYILIRNYYRLLIAVER